MQLATNNYTQFQRQAHSQQDIVTIQNLNQQIFRLQKLKLQNPRQPLNDKKLIEKYIKIYKLAIKEIQRMKRVYTTPSQVNQRLAQIFDSEKQQLTLQPFAQKSSEIRSSQIQIPTFKKTVLKENVIQVSQEKNDLGSPALRNFFEKKEAQINHKKSKSNFKSLIQTQQNKQASRSISKQQSRSSASSFMKKPSQQTQLRKVLEQNKKIKQQYEMKLKRELELSEFEKNLLKDEKNRYMLKIEELETELENLYRANYKMKEEVIVKEKTLKEKSQFDNSSSFRNVDENINTPLVHGKDYYQPYVMKTKHNDLKRLNMKCQTEYDPSEQNHSQEHLNIPHNKNINNNANNQPEDILGKQLQRQLQEIDRQYSRSHQSSRSGKKWAQQYNPGKMVNNNNAEDNDLISVLKKTDSEDNLPQTNNNNGSNYPKNNGNNGYNTKIPFEINKNNNSKNPFQKKPQNSFSRQQPFKSFHQDIPPINILPPSMNRKPSSQPIFNSATSLQQRAPQIYQPQSNYSFTKVLNKDYSMTSNPNNYDTFEMTKTYLNISQDEQSQTNKYIDSRTSTRNKVAFFKDSLILIKNETFELAFKRSALVNTKDRVRIIFFVKNKTNQALTVSFRYEYDAGYFKLKVNQKIQTIPPNSQARQDLQIYAFSTIDLNEVIDVMVDVDFNKYGLWMPALWIQFQNNDHFKLPDKSQQISILPDKQFKNYQSAQTVVPLMFGGKNAYSQWAYLYGVCKFGPCFVKLTWEGSQLKIQTDPKWIDILAFVMHHVK